MQTPSIRSFFNEREPILKSELGKALNITNPNTLNQTISYLVSFGILKRFENGLYFIPSSDEKFAHLTPSLKDILYKKYLMHFNGIKTGAHLLYKYKFTSQVSSYYELLTNNVSPSTRSKKLYGGKVIVSYPPLKLSEDTINYFEFLELVKQVYFGRLLNNTTKKQLLEIMNQMHLNKKEISRLGQYYMGKRYSGFRMLIEEITQNEVAQK